MASPIKSHSNQPGSVRIIGGEWRGRRVPVPGVSGVRPSSDRVRETLFNWLQFDLPGRDCIDLFGGSGVLGLEAASRGARSVIIVDRDPQVVSSIQHQVDQLNANSRVQVFCADALAWINSGTERFDIAFVDPPFHENLVASTCECLETRQRLRSGARVYLEAEREAQFSLPSGWQQRKSKFAGQVGYHLYERTVAVSQSI